MNPMIDLAGWTLIHFVWQGAAVAVIAAGLMWLLRHRSPVARYGVACVALVAMLAAPIITAMTLSRSVSVAGATAPLSVPHQAGPGDDTVPDAAAMLRNLSMARGLSSLDVVKAGPRLWLPSIVLAWLIGVAAFFIRMLGGWWRIHRLHRVARATSPSVWTKTAARLADTLGLSGRVHIVDSSVVDTPTVIGWIRPVILLPVAALAGLSASQVEAILVHELAHIRRHDFLVNLLQTLAETMLFYHPAVWWLSARIRVEREHCCDEIALAVCGDALSYAEALVELERWRRVHPPLAMAATGGPLMTRVRRVLGAPALERPQSVGAIAAVLIAVVCIGSASVYLFAAQPDRRSPPMQGSTDDPAPWSMIFNQADSTMRFIGFRGRDLIRFAYQIPKARVIGGPSWLDEQTLNITVNLDSARRRNARHRPRGAPVTPSVEDARGAAEFSRAGVGDGQGRPRLGTAAARREPPVLRHRGVDCGGATSGPTRGVAGRAAVRGHSRNLPGVDRALVGDYAGFCGVPARLREGMADDAA
jgi:beta-lactamase regulating signal transducer with metallopeptidase domain